MQKQFKKSDWLNMPIVLSATDTNPTVRRDADGKLWAWKASGLRVTAELFSDRAPGALADLPKEGATLDVLTKKHTGFDSFRALVTAPAYFPSIHCKTAGACTLASGAKITARAHRAELTKLADAYDLCQWARGDSRRAFRS